MADDLVPIGRLLRILRSSVISFTDNRVFKARAPTSKPKSVLRMLKKPRWKKTKSVPFRYFLISII